MAWLGFLQTEESRREMESRCTQAIRTGERRPAEFDARGEAVNLPVTRASDPKERSYQDRPLFLLALLIGVVAVVDFGVILAVAHLFSVSGFLEAAIDSLALVAVAFPILLILVVRPLHQQIAWRKEKEVALRKTIEELEQSKAEIGQLRGLLPICASCKRIRDGDQQWILIEKYIEVRSEASFTHGICPECVRTLYPNHRAGQRPQDSDGGGA
jgi:hypothetical protein